MPLPWGFREVTFGCFCCAYNIASHCICGICLFLYSFYSFFYLYLFMMGILRHALALLRCIYILAMVTVYWDESSPIPPLQFMSVAPLIKPNALGVLSPNPQSLGAPLGAAIFSFRGPLNEPFGDPSIPSWGAPLGPPPSRSPQRWGSTPG